MVKFQLFSDAHCDMPALGQPGPELTEADYLIGAGDWGHSVEEAFDYASRYATRHQKTVIACLGNHDLSNGVTLDELDDRIAELNQLYSGDVIMLQNSHWVSPDRSTAVFGSLFFTNYTLDAFPSAKADAIAYNEAAYWDHRHIGERRNAAGQRVVLKYQGWMKQHEEAVLQLQLFLAATQGMRQVVMTHYAPSNKSLNPHFLKDKFGVYTSHCYASSLEHEMGWEGVWVHGHMHHSNDYFVGKTRVLSNPIGTNTGNPQFNPKLIFT